jgi:hypothetical protein
VKELSRFRLADNSPYKNSIINMQITLENGDLHQCFWLNNMNGLFPELRQVIKKNKIKTIGMGKL